MVVADWAIHLGFPDPVAAYRGAYDSKESSEAFVAAAGGLVPIFEAGNASIGWVKVDRPQVGAVGVIGARDNWSKQMGAIFDGGHWQVFQQPGWIALMAVPLAIWAAPVSSASARRSSHELCENFNTFFSFPIRLDETGAQPLEPLRMPLRSTWA
ncbi:hypothetical protein [Mesorhizobium sp. WSM2239]|uniref:Uncharacterized protein n=2 Tax=unclassified Mesorhizobium TaxID=325217 RepID=A0AAU8D2H3_9HYPH